MEDPADEPVHQAQRLFARFTEAGVPEGDPRRPKPVPASEPSAPAPPPSVAGHQERPADVAEALEIARAALAATDHLAAYIELVCAQSDAISTDLAALSSATRRALEDTNERLGVLERSLLGDGGQLDEPADQATARQRRTIPRTPEAGVAD